MRKILAVTAHPDDEAGNFGGTLAKYAEAGVQVRLVCCTAGEAARNRGSASTPAELQALRRGELAASCRILGIAEHEVWDLPDGGMPKVDFHAAAGRLVGVMREYRPDILMTMGPEGSATAHPDHGMAGMLATAAFHWAAQEKYFPELSPTYQAARLFYATVEMQPPQFPKVWLPPIDVEIDIAAYLERKIEAFRAHTTQAPLFERVEWFLRMGGGRERFHLASGLPLEVPATDLFVGMTI